jgi:hypothetical protein
VHAYVGVGGPEGTTLARERERFGGGGAAVQWLVVEKAVWDH